MEIRGCEVESVSERFVCFFIFSWRLGKLGGEWFVDHLGNGQTWDLRARCVRRTGLREGASVKVDNT